MCNSHMKYKNYLVDTGTILKYDIARLTSHFSEALSPRLPDLIKYSLPVPSERVSHVEDEKCIEAQRRSS